MKSYLFVALVALSTANLYSANPVTPPRAARPVPGGPPALVRRPVHAGNFNHEAIHVLGLAFAFNLLVVEPGAAPVLAAPVLAAHGAPAVDPAAMDTDSDTE